MTFRYSRAWSERDSLGRALLQAGCWRHAVPRIGDLFPGIATPMPESASVSFADACDARATELLAVHDNLVVLWSGGIDSTLVVCKLLEHKRVDQTVYITVNDQAASVGKDYLPALIQAGVKTTTFDRDNLLEMAGRGIRLITGYHADSILVGEFYDNPKISESIWTISPEEAIRLNACDLNPALARSDRKTQENFARRTLEQLEPLLALMPLERTAANIGWWLDFTSYWERDEYELYFRLGLDKPGAGYISFFNSTPIQQWALQDTRDKAGRNGTHHKHLYLTEISKHIGDIAPPNKAIMNDIGWYRTCLGDSRLLLIREDYSTVVTS
jgi:hypothetical protein